RGGRRTKRCEPWRSRWREAVGPRGMRTSKARAGHRAGKPCHRRRAAYVRPLTTSGFASCTRGRSRVPELGTLGSVRGVARNGHPYRDKGGVVYFFDNKALTRAGNISSVSAL